MTAGPQLIGRMVAGRFRITGFIGEGAMAAVYRGVQDAEPRDVAIKIMHPQLLGDSTFVGRFRREAKAAARLHHPNTVQIIDYGVDGRLPYIVMELVAGKDLFEILVLERRLPEARAARIMMGVCDALAAAHEHGIVHRDLKPENVMILRDPQNPAIERVKVLDFGIAKIVEASGPVSEDGMPASLSTQALTTVGVVVGTPAYMSPEQCRGDPVDGRSDVYACGIMLYLLVTGRLPFQPTGAPWEVAMEHLRKPPPAPSTFLPGIHPGLEAAILTALAKWPAQRQQTAAEMRDELAKLLPALADTITGGARAPAGEDDALPVESLRSRAVQSVRAAVEEEDQEDQQWGDDRPGPPSFRADTETRPVLMDTLRPPGPPSEGAVPTRRRAGPDDKTDPVPVEVARGLAAPVIDPPPSSEEPPLGARVIGADGADLAGAPPAAAGDPAGSGGRVWTTTKVSPISPLAGVAPPPQVDVIAPPPRPGGAPPAPLRVAPRDEQTAPARRRPQRYRSEADIARLIVPAAVLVGVALGVLAFLLMR